MASDNTSHHACLKGGWLGIIQTDELSSASVTSLPTLATNPKLSFRFNFKWTVRIYNSIFQSCCTTSTGSIQKGV